MNKINLKIAAIAAWAVVVVLLVLLGFKYWNGRTNTPTTMESPVPQPAESTAQRSHTPTPKTECIVPADDVEPFLREQFNQLLTQQGALADKQHILDCITKATSKASENTIIIDGNYHTFSGYIAASDAKIITISSVKFYPTAPPFQSVKIQGTTTNTALVKEVASQSATTTVATPTNTVNSNFKGDDLSVNTFPNELSGNIVTGGSIERLKIERKTAIGSQIEFKFSVRFADKGGKNLAGKLDTQTKSAELEKIGTGSYNYENGVLTFLLNNGDIKLTSKK